MLTKITQIALLLLSACQKEPKLKPLKDNPVKTYSEVQKRVMELNVPTYIEIYENEAFSQAIDFFVPQGNSATLEVLQIPEGANFDYQNNILSWTPNHFDANDPNNFNIQNKIYTILFNLTDQDQKQISKKLTLNVLNKKRLNKITANQSYPFIMKENEAFDFTLDILDEDFPNGPFKVNIEFPFPIQFKWLSKNKLQFHVSAPPINLVNPLNFSSSDNMGFFIENNQDLISIENPYGDQNKFPLIYKIYDKREALTFFYDPKAKLLNNNPVFFIKVYDANEENKINFSLIKQAAFGSVSTKAYFQKSFNVFEIRWDITDPLDLNKEAEFQIEACYDSFPTKKCEPINLTRSIIQGGN